MIDLSYIPFYKGSLRVEYLGKVVYGVSYMSGLVLSKNLVGRVPRYFLDYVKGRRVEFSDLELATGLGTDFDYKVWKATRLIRYGEVRSYKWLAERVGGKKYARAVASSLSRNPFLIVVPCHRVIRSDGGSGGFSSEDGIELKRYMLELEGVARLVKYWG